MGRNRNFVNQGNRLMLQGLEASYYAPKQELNLERDFKGFTGWNLAQLKSKVEADFVKSYKDADGNQVSNQVVEYLDRQQTQNQKWRLETNSTMDFKAGGKVIVAGQEFLIAKVLTILTTGTRTNKFLAMRTPLGWQRYGNKMIVLM